MAEIIPLNLTDNAGVGVAGTKTIIRAISYEGKRGMAFVVSETQLRKRNEAELVSRLSPKRSVAGLCASVEKIGLFELRVFFFRLCPREIRGAGRPKNPRFALNAPFFKIEI